MTDNRFLFSPYRMYIKILFAFFAVCGLVVWKVFSISYMFGFDYQIYHQAAGLALNGVDPYVPFGIQLDVGTSYLYHPAFLLLVAPLTVLDPLLAALIWSLFSIALLYATWRMLMQRSSLNKKYKFFLIALVVVSAGVAESLWMGQVNALVVFLLTFSVFNADSRPKLAGLSLAVAVVSKTSPVIFILYFLASRRWQAALWAVIGVAALSLAAIIVFGWPVMAQFLNVGLQLTATDASDKGLSLAVVMSDLGFPYALAVWIQRGLAGALIGSALLAVYKNRNSHLAFAAMLTGMVVASPLLWGHHAVLALSAFAIFAQYRWGWTLIVLSLIQVEMIAVYVTRMTHGVMFSLGWLLLIGGLLYELWTRHIIAPDFIASDAQVTEISA